MLVALGIRRHDMRRPHPYRTVVLVWKAAMFLLNEIKPHRFRAAVGYDQRATIEEKKPRARDNRTPFVRFDGCNELHTKSSRY